MRHTRMCFHSLIDVCDRFLERTKWSRSGAQPGRELFIARLASGAHGGVNGLVPLLPASLFELDKATRVALGERNAEKCAMRKTQSGGFWIVSPWSQGTVHWVQGQALVAELLYTHSPHSRKSQACLFIQGTAHST